MRSSYLASVRDAYELSIDLLMDAHGASPGGDDLVRAFDVSERGRARAMLDGLAQAQGGLVENAADDLLAQERRLRASMNAAAAGRLAALQRGRLDEATRMSRDLDRLSAAHRDLEERIRAESPGYASLLEQAPLGLAEVQQLLDDNTILLQYFVGTETSYVWIVTHAHVTARRLPGRAEIVAVVRPYLAALCGPPQPGRSPVESARAATLLLPLELRRSQHTRVVIVPDGILHQVPFAALPFEHSEGPAASALAANREVVAVPSMSIVSLIRRGWQGPHEWLKPLLVLADPVFELDDPRLTGAGERASGAGVAVPSESNGEALRRALRDVGLRQAASPPRLLAARREAAGIAAVVPGADVALGFAASRAAVTSTALGAYRIVHFATHGIIDNDHPELSGLVLSLVDERGRWQDGFVRVHDVYALQVPADLVVLSACRTALGADLAGEGLIGLVRGFMFAGTRRVVASLWKVDDEATSELMVRFYRAMVERKLTPPAALREAQLEIRAIPRWSHPFYWAAFVLYGEWLD
jgi:CHAT domain-containing protein